MIHDWEPYTKLNITIILKVRIGNEANIVVKGKGIVVIKGYIVWNQYLMFYMSLKLIKTFWMLLYCWKNAIRHYLKTKKHIIKDVEGKEVLKVQMKGKS